MKHIGIDARLLFQTGVGTYIQNLLHFLPEFSPVHFHYTIYCLPDDVDYVKKELPHYRVVATHARWHSWNEQVGFLSTINRDNLDLMHFTYFGHPILYNRPAVSTIHDITPLLYKTGRASTRNALVYTVKYAAFSAVLRNQISRSVAIITPTQTVKEQLMRIYGDSSQDKIHAIHEGISFSLLTEKGGERAIETPYYLYVGNFYPHKNVEFLIRAFAKSNSSHRIVLAGPHDYFLKRLLASLSSDEKKHLIIKERQTRSELISLYQNAKALIHPSISEGFGLPLVEAIHFGLPIIASHIPVFQELLGTSYYSFDPYEESSFISALHTFESDETKKINSMQNDFSFQEMTKKTVELYRNHA